MHLRKRIQPASKPAVNAVSIQTVERSKYKIRRRPTKTRGIAIDLEYWYKGDRFRPTLGYDLTNDTIDTAAAKMVLKIQSGEADQVQKRHAAGSMTMADFKAAYLDELRERRVADIHRAEKVIDTYLALHFTMPLRKIRYSDGQGY